ncbi:MAG: DUF308 domain-containing protein [Bacteroidia bacterium]|nr:DUF308 domain-containing protein [Bacteroidia bacterium]
MKLINYSVIRALFALIVGLVLVFWPDFAATYMIVIVGFGFLIPGLIHLFSYLLQRKSATTTSDFSPSPSSLLRFPIEGVGSVLFGMWLIIMPSFFIDILLFLLGLILVIAGGQQLISLGVARRWITVPWGFYMTPILILSVGLFMLIKPTETRRTAFILMGATAIVYAIMELFYWFKFMRYRPIHELEGAERVDEMKE